MTSLEPSQINHTPTHSQRAHCLSNRTCARRNNGPPPPPARRLRSFSGTNFFKSARARALTSDYSAISYAFCVFSVCARSCDGLFIHACAAPPTPNDLLIIYCFRSVCSDAQTHKHTHTHARIPNSMSSCGACEQIFALHHIHTHTHARALYCFWAGSPNPPNSL